MRRRSAILFFGSIAAVTIAWLGWAARPIIREPPVVFGAKVPQEVRERATAWLAENPSFGKRSYDLEMYLGFLCHPRTAVIDPIIVDFYRHHAYGHMITITRRHERRVTAFHRSAGEGEWYGPTFH
jgi:hypothetical protein